MQLKLANKLRANQSKILLAALSVPVTVLSVFVALVALSAPSLSRVEVHQYYIQGYRQGRASAMAKQGVNFLDSASLPDTFYREYMRGYRDGYQLIVR